MTASNFEEGFILTTDEWLERKRKQDGGEGLWRIHNKLYDFTMWSRIHPGGKFWLDVTRGTDITEAFETHHFTSELDTLLEKYYLREAATPRVSFTTFKTNQFYKEFKRQAKDVASSYSGTSWKTVLLNDSLAVAVFLTAFLGAKDGNFWALICGVFMGLLATFSHDFLHSKYNWRVNYFDLSLMSSREWRMRHVLSHHQYRGTFLDLEITTWKPFVKLFPSKHNLGLKLIKWATSFILFGLFAHLQFMKRCLDVFLSRKLEFHREELIPFSLPLFILICTALNPWDVFVVWNGIIFVGSFFFCLLNFTSRNLDEKISSGNDRRERDFGETQLSLTENHPVKENNSILSKLNSHRNNSLHYLCPTTKIEDLTQLLPVFEKTCQKFGISYQKGPLQEFLDETPRGHVFFS